MLCKYPVVLGKDRIFGCGRCITCRINKRRQWTNRIVLESALYEDNAFVTMTYSDENLPEDLSVDKGELQRFLKRLRKSYGEQIRYFGVGEYGERTHRPHYHIMLFGYPTCFHGRTRGKDCCKVCVAVEKIWGLGNVFLGEVSFESAAYVASYVVKGWTKDTPIGVDPEFTIKSLKPGLAEGFAHEIASSLLRDNADCVPRVVRYSGKRWPLGRYMLDKISEYTGGLPIADAPEQKEVFALSKSIFDSTEIKPGQKAWAVREEIIAQRIHKIQNLEKKHERYTKRKAL